MEDSDPPVTTITVIGKEIPVPPPGDYPEKYR
jgi:hypothetical protein